MKNKNHIKIQAGFTLIELMIALAILSIGMLGIMSMHIGRIPIFPVLKRPVF
ncbi:MAG: prepilin-type N-terminal cleavage/methylation domain-containing protein [Desulfobacter sp.]|nr:prepilin-type N-terminal cleavage/methylation domain-containing protein [Desulfobacter sp.]WDP86594.1 MAG: prepilin-type N-terminal cleavage/methylation domain-containing protein [Desulfobacter sp.]